MKKIPYMNLYVLKLQEGKYYVGTTHNVEKRYQMHKTGKGAEWTKIYPPVKILSIKQYNFCDPKKALLEEDGMTIQMMKKYGRNNVRGGRFVAVEQEKIDELLGYDRCKIIDQYHEAELKKAKRAKKMAKKRSIPKTKHSEQTVNFWKFEFVYIDEDFSDTKSVIESKVQNIKGKTVVFRIPIKIDQKNNTVYISKKYQKSVDQIRKEHEKEKFTKAEKAPKSLFLP